MKATVKLSSLQYTPGEYSLFNPDWIGFPSERIQELKTGETDLIKGNYDGSFKFDGDIVTITYEEKRPVNARTEISVDTNAGSAVIRKTGEVKAVIEIKNDTLITKPYLTVMGNFQLATKGIKIRSDFSDRGGTLYLDYISEIQGLDAQRIIMRISVRKGEGRD